MSLARTISRGARLKLRLGVNGSQYDSRSLGAGAAAGRVWAISISDLTDAIACRLLMRLLPPRHCYPPRDGGQNGGQSGEIEQAQAAPAPRIDRPQPG